MNTLSGKVAFVTGAARGQGRSHAIELARAGADIIAIDIAHDEPELGLGYALGSADELAETAKEVENLDRRIVTAQVDVRDGDALAAALRAGVQELGRSISSLPTRESRRPPSRHTRSPRRNGIRCWRSI